MYFLDRPALLDELSRQIVEQLGMRRRRAHDAEVVGSANDAVAKVMLPEAIDENACAEWVCRNDQSPGQLQTTAPRCARGHVGTKYFGRPARRSVADRLVVAAQ